MHSHILSNTTKPPCFAESLPGEHFQILQDYQWLSVSNDRKFLKVNQVSD